MALICNYYMKYSLLYSERTMIKKSVSFCCKITSRQSERKNTIQISQNELVQKNNTPEKFTLLHRIWKLFDFKQVKFSHVN